MPDGMMNISASHDEITARVNALIRRRNKRDDTAIIEATKLFPIWQAYVSTKPDEEQEPFLTVAQQIEEIVWKTPANSDAALLARVEFSLEHGEVTQRQERSVLENVRDHLRTKVNEPDTCARPTPDTSPNKIGNLTRNIPRPDLALDALRDVEGDIYALERIGGILLHMGSSEYSVERGEVDLIGDQLLRRAKAIVEFYEKIWPLCGGSN